MKVSILKDIELDSSNVTASSYSEYDYTGSTTYNQGDYIKVSYESDGTTERYPIEEYIVTAVTTTAYPPTSSDWSLVGASNRWKMFDGHVSSQTENSNSIEVEIDAGRSNSVGIFNIIASDLELTHIVDTELFSNGDGSSDDCTKETGWSYTGTAWACSGSQTTDTKLYQSETGLTTDLWVQIKFTLSSYSAGNITGYAYGNEGEDVSANGTYTQIIKITNTTDSYIGLIADSDFIGTVDNISIKFVSKYEDISLGTISAADYYAYFFDEVSYLSDVLIYYPQYSSATLRIKLYSSSITTIKCGLVVVGKSNTLGFSEWEPSVGILDYSIKDVDDLGRTTLVQGDYAKRIDADIFFDSNSQIDAVYRALTSIRGVPALWDFNNDDMDVVFESLILYGYYEEFDEVISNYSFAECNIRINGLT